MSFQTVQLDVVGPSYESRSKPLSSQVSRNMYAEIDPTGKSKKSLHSWPGKKTFSTLTGSSRGMMNATWKGNVYCVNGTSLYKINNLAVSTLIGTVSGTGRCVFAASSTYVYIVCDGLIWRSDGTTVSQVTDVDFETPNSVAFLNSALIYDGDDGRFAVSDIGDGGSVSGLNYATAEALPDGITRVYAFNQILYLFGEQSTEPWYNSGVDSPPYSRVEGGLMQVGIAGIHAVTNNNKYMYFLSHDLGVYRVTSYDPHPVHTSALSNAMESYTVTNDAFMESLTLQGQDFIILSFPTADKTWCYNETSNSWCELSSGVLGGRDKLNGHCYAFGKNLVSDYLTGNIYELDIGTYTDGDDVYIRERIIEPTSGIDIERPGKRMMAGRVELIVETGVGLAVGQGVAPVFMMSHSVDGGRTWSEEANVSPGVLGDYTAKVEYFAFFSGYEFTIKIRVSDPINVSIHAAAADIEFLGY